MSDNKFLKGAAILGVAGIVTKIIGVFFRIPLTNWVGAEGIAYYSLVYPIYTLFLILSTSGIPVAISRMVAERIAVKNYGGAHRVFQVSVWLMMALGAISFALVHFGAGWIESALKAPDSRFAFEAVAPSLFIVPIMAAYRGYFQGRQNMNPTAISQLTEQFFRVVVGLGLAYYLIDTGSTAVSAGAVFGGTFGAGVGLATVIVIYIFSYKYIKRKINRHKSKAEVESVSKIVKTILVIAIPITIGACILPLVNTADAAIVMRRLQDTGWSYAESKLLWGRLEGYCTSLIGMPQVLIQAIVMSLVPAIAAGYKLKNHKEIGQNIQFAMRASMVIGFPCAVGIFAMAKPILMMLYPGQLQEAMDAAPTLMVMSLSVIFSSTMQTLTGALQGIDKQMLPVKNLAYGAIAKVAFTYILVGIPLININGAPIGTIATYGIASILNLKDIKKYTGIKFDNMQIFVKPFINSAIMGVLALLSYKIVFAVIHSNSLATLIGIIIGGISYTVLILVTKTITTEELGRVPKGDKLVKIIDKVNNKLNLKIKIK